MEIEVTVRLIRMIFRFRYFISQKIYFIWESSIFLSLFRVSEMSRNWGWWWDFMYVEASWRIRNSSYFREYGIPFICLGSIYRPHGTFHGQLEYISEDSYL